jgi:hypothetical protein
MIVTRRRDDLVAATETMLLDDVRPDVGVGRIGEIAHLGAANEARLARRIEPALRRAIRNDDRRRSRLARLAAIAATLITTVVAPVMPAATLLVAAALATSAIASTTPSAAMSAAALALVLPVLLIVVVAAGVFGPAVGAALALSRLTRGGGRLGSAVVSSVAHAGTGGLAAIL